MSYKEGGFKSLPLPQAKRAGPELCDLIFEIHSFHQNNGEKSNRSKKCKKASILSLFEAREGKTLHKL